MIYRRRLSVRGVTLGSEGQREKGVIEQLQAGNNMACAGIPGVEQLQRSNDSNESRVNDRKQSNKEELDGLD